MHAAVPVCWTTVVFVSFRFFDRLPPQTNLQKSICLARRGNEYTPIQHFAHAAMQIFHAENHVFMRFPLKISGLRPKSRILRDEPKRNRTYEHISLSQDKDKRTCLKTKRDKNYSTALPLLVPEQHVFPNSWPVWINVFSP